MNKEIYFTNLSYQKAKNKYTAFNTYEY